MLSMTRCSGSEMELCSYNDIPRYGWAYGDTISFATDILSDSVTTGHLIVALRHTNSYPFSNIWLEVTHSGSDNIPRRDTINCTLADIYGRWQGQGFGASYQYADTIPARMEIKRGNPLTIRHIMRVDTLRDIEHLGIMLVP